MGIVLFIVSLILTIPLFIFNVVFALFYDLITLKWFSGLSSLNKWFRELAISVDQFGNASCYRTLNATMIKKGGYTFGDVDQTVSFVLGVNQERATLSMFGKFIVNVLNFIEKDHCIKAVEFQKQNDLKAKLRLETNGI